MNKTQLSRQQAIAKVFSFAMPISAGLCINMISSFIATMMVAKLGEKQLAAGALAVSTNITIMTIVATFFYAVGISIGHLRGQQQASTAIGKVIKNGLWMAVGLAIPSGLALWNIDHVLVLFKQDPALIQIAKSYFQYSSFAVLPMLFNTVYGQFFTGISKPRFTMITSLISLPMMISLSYVLILGRLGFPALGLAGMSCATLIVQATLAIAITAFLTFNSNYHKYQLFSGRFLPELASIKRLITLGFPIGVQFGAELTAMTLATYFMGYFGVMALAASQVASQYSLLIVMIILGLSQAVSVLTSEAYGSKDFNLIRQYIHAGISILVITFVGIFIACMCFPEPLINIFINGNERMNPEMITLSMRFLMIAAVMLFIDGLRNLFSGALRGLHDAKTPMNVGVICMWFISLPVCYLVGISFQAGPIGLRIGFISGFAVATVILYYKIRNKLNPQRIQLTETLQQAPEPS